MILILASGDHVRDLMLHAYDHGMTNGEFVFLTIELFRSSAWGSFSWKRGRCLFWLMRKIVCNDIVATLNVNSLAIYYNIC